MLRMSMYILIGFIIESEVIIRKIIIWYYKNMYMYYIYVLEIFFDFNSMDMFSINWYMCIIIKFLLLWLNVYIYLYFF